VQGQSLAYNAREAPLEQMFGAGARPAAALTLEASRDLHFDVLFNHAASRPVDLEAAGDGRDGDPRRLRTNAAGRGA
jgi:hypothetical protein